MYHHMPAVSLSCSLGPGRGRRAAARGRARWRMRRSWVLTRGRGPASAQVSRTLMSLALPRRAGSCVGRNALLDARPRRTSGKWRGVLARWTVRARCDAAWLRDAQRVMAMPRTLITRVVCDERRQQFEQSLPAGGRRQWRRRASGQEQAQAPAARAVRDTAHALTTCGLQHPPDMSDASARVKCSRQCQAGTSSGGAGAKGWHATMNEAREGGEAKWYASLKP